MDFEQFEEEKPKIPTNLLVFVIVSALVIAFSIYYISKSGKQRPLTTEELVEGDTLYNEEPTTAENAELANAENETEEEALGEEETQILKNVKRQNNTPEKVEQEEMMEEKTSNASPTPTKTVSLEKKNAEKKKNIDSHNTSPKANKSDNVQGILHVHTVRKNEFLSSIASMYNFSSKEIKELNGIDEDLKVGQKIKVKVQAIHKVKKNEQLAKIAQKYGVRVTDICKINGIKKDAQLKEGQKIVIPLKLKK
ncbi:MAG: hypothetical protein KatS3mg035_1587 [Bacteroidia bacterium]|nr:MAG: hypothetical protein KatS3mg035_1587 [Bacteroidia bacterium]